MQRRGFNFENARINNLHMYVHMYIYIVHTYLCKYVQCIRMYVQHKYIRIRGYI